MTTIIACLGGIVLGGCVGFLAVALFRAGDK